MKKILAAVIGLGLVAWAHAQQSTVGTGGGGGNATNVVLRPSTTINVLTNDVGDWTPSVNTNRVVMSTNGFGTNTVFYQPTNYFTSGRREPLWLDAGGPGDLTSGVQLIDRSQGSNTTALNLDYKDGTTIMYWGDNTVVAHSFRTEASQPDVRWTFPALNSDGDEQYRAWKLHTNDFSFYYGTAFHGYIWALDDNDALTFGSTNGPTTLAGTNVTIGHLAAGTNFFTGTNIGNFAGATNLNGTEIRSGTVAADRLGSSGGAGKFLRYDNTWQTVAGGAGSASNAIASISTNGVLITSSVVTNIDLTNGANITITGYENTGTGVVNVALISVPTFIGSNITSLNMSNALHGRLSSLLMESNAVVKAGANVTVTTNLTARGVNEYTVAASSSTAVGSVSTNGVQVNSTTITNLDLTNGANILISGYDTLGTGIVTIAVSQTPTFSSITTTGTGPNILYGDQYQTNALIVTTGKLIWSNSPAGNGITNVNGNTTNSGTIAAVRFVGSGSNLTDVSMDSAAILAADNVWTGSNYWGGGFQVFSYAGIFNAGTVVTGDTTNNGWVVATNFWSDGGSFYGDGANLTGIGAANITSGTLALERLAGVVVTNGFPNALTLGGVFTATNSFLVGPTNFGNFAATNWTTTIPSGWMNTNVAGANMGVTISQGNIMAGSNITANFTASARAYVSTTNAFAGPTNSLDLDLGRQFYVATTSCAITNFINTSSTLTKDARLRITNASAGNITFYLTDSNAMTTDGARSWTITNSTVSIISVSSDPYGTFVAFRPVW